MKKLLFIAMIVILASCEKCPRYELEIEEGQNTEKTFLNPRATDCSQCH